MTSRPMGTTSAIPKPAGIPQDPSIDLLIAKSGMASPAVDVGGNPPRLHAATRQGVAGPSDYSAVILLADVLDDLEAVRIANENRLRTLTRTDEHGKAVPGDLVAPVSNLIDQLSALEHGAILELKRAVRRSPLADFQKETLGLGEKTLGRLIKEIGDPAWNYGAERPRTVRELYAYCGLHVLPAHKTSASHGAIGGDTGAQDRLDGQTGYGVGEFSGGDDAQGRSDLHLSSGVAPSRIRGQKANWSTQAKTRLYLIAESMVKNRRSAYRHVYDAGREKYAESVHTTECKRCGPSGKPALVGSDLSDGHKHARAMRLVMKAFLKDLWRAAQ